MSLTLNMHVTCLCTVVPMLIVVLLFIPVSVTLEPEFAEESFEELPETETETEDPATSDPSATYPGKGVYISLPYNSQLACLAVFRAVV